MLNIRFEIWRQPLNFYVGWPWHSTQNTCPWKSVEYLSNNYISKSSLIPLHVYLETVIKKFINLVKINSNFGPIFFSDENIRRTFKCRLITGSGTKTTLSKNLSRYSVFFDVQYPQIKTRNLELYLSACLSVSHNSFRITFHNF